MNPALLPIVAVSASVAVVLVVGWLTHRFLHIVEVAVEGEEQPPRTEGAP